MSAIVTSRLGGDDFPLGGFAGLSLGIWVMLWSIYSIVERFKNQRNWLIGIRKTPASIWGMAVAHFGIAVFIIGVTHVNTYSQEKDIRLSLAKAIPWENTNSALMACVLCRNKIIRPIKANS